MDIPKIVRFTNQYLENIKRTAEESPGGTDGNLLTNNADDGEDEKEKNKDTENTDKD